MGLRLATSQRTTTLSPPAVARIFPSGLKRAVVTDTECPLSGTSNALRLAISQDHSAVIAGGGENFAVRTEGNTPDTAGMPFERFAQRLRLEISHRIIVLSSLPLARIFPSALNATLITPAVCPLSGSPTGSRLAIPENHCLVSSSCSQNITVWAKGNGCLPAVCPLSGLPNGLRLPTSQRTAVASLLVLTGVFLSGLKTTVDHHPNAPQIQTKSGGKRIRNPPQIIDCFKRQSLLHCSHSRQKSICKLFARFLPGLSRELKRKRCGSLSLGQVAIKCRQYSKRNYYPHRNLRMLTSLSLLVIAVLDTVSDVISLFGR